MGPDKNKNTGAAFEQLIDTIFFGDDGAGREDADDDYIEFIEEEPEEETTSDEE